MDLAFRSMPARCADGQALPSPSTIYCDHDTDPVAIAAWAREMIHYPLMPPILHMRLFTPDLSYGGLVVLHNISAAHDVELLAFISPGTTITRTLVRALAHWIFIQQKFRRVTMRFRGDDLKARDYARRLGFCPEGVQRRWFADDVDAYLWGMLRSECPWLNRT